jgi:hypothetical protein
MPSLPWTSVPTSSSLSDPPIYRKNDSSTNATSKQSKLKKMIIIMIIIKMVLVRQI